MENILRGDGLKDRALNAFAAASGNGRWIYALADTAKWYLENTQKLDGVTVVTLSSGSMMFAADGSVHFSTSDILHQGTGTDLCVVGTGGLICPSVWSRSTLLIGFAAACPDPETVYLSAQDVRYRCILAENDPAETAAEIIYRRADVLDIIAGKTEKLPAAEKQTDGTEQIIPDGCVPVPGMPGAVYASFSGEAEQGQFGGFSGTVILGKEVTRINAGAFLSVPDCVICSGKTAFGRDWCAGTKKKTAVVRY